MASFGQFEVLEEIESDGYTTVFRACKAGSSVQFAVKLLTVTRHLPSSATSETTHRPAGEPHVLTEALELNFLEAVKLQRRAAEAGAANLAPVHEFGMDERGAWFVTDYYSRGTLRHSVRLQRRVDAEELTWIVHSLLQGLCALKAVGGRSHGQLRASKIFLGGRTRTPLRRTPIMISEPDAGRLSAAECELADLRALGQLIYELVHRREIEAEEAPFLVGAPSDEWAGLGDKAEFWRELCKELLHRHLSLEKTTIERLAVQIRPRRSPLVPALAGGVTAAVVAGGILFLIFHDPGPTLAKVKDVELLEGEIITLSIKVRPGKGTTPLIFETPPTDVNGPVKLEAVTAGSQATNIVLHARTNRTGQARQAKLTLRVSAGSKSNERTVTVTVKSRDTPPVIPGELPDLTNRVNGDPARITIAVSERETPRKVRLTATSTDSKLLPNLGKSVAPEGNGTNWFLTISPAQDRAGPALITLEATDGKLKTNRQFWVEFTNSPPAIRFDDSSPLTMTVGSARASRVVRVSDGETPPSRLKVSVSRSTNENVVPANNISISDQKSQERTVTIQPKAGQIGSTLITLRITDGITNREAALLVTVVRGNTAPSIDRPPDRTNTLDEGIQSIPLVVRDAETADLRKLQLNATSSNQTLLPNSNISTNFGKSGWELIVRPMANQHGVTKISVSVSDGELATNTSFRLSINPPPPSLAFAPISPVVTNMNWRLTPIPLQFVSSIGDLGGLQVSAHSSDNPALIPTNQITARGEGTNWTLSLTPRSNQIGTAKITLTARHSLLSRPVTTDFRLTITNGRPEFVSFSPTYVSAVTGIMAGPVSVVISDDGPTNSWNVWATPPAAMVMTIDVQRNRTNSCSVWVRGTNQTLQPIDVFVSDGQLTNTKRFFVTFTNPPPMIAPSLAIVGLPTDTVMANMNSMIGPLGFRLQALGFSPKGDPTVTPGGSDADLIAAVTPKRGASATNWSVSVRPQPNVIGERRVSLIAEWDGNRATNFFQVWFTNRPPYFASLSSMSVTGRVGELTPPIAVTVADPDTQPSLLQVSADPSSVVPTNQIIINGEGANRSVQVSSNNPLDHVRVSLVVSDGQSHGTTNFLVTFIAPVVIPPVVLGGSSNQTPSTGGASKGEGGTQTEMTLRRLQSLRRENKAAEAINELDQLPPESRAGPEFAGIYEWATNKLVRSSPFAFVEVWYGTLNPGQDIVDPQSKKQSVPHGGGAVDMDDMKAHLRGLMKLKEDPRIHRLLKERIAALTNAIIHKMEQSAK